MPAHPRSRGENTASFFGSADTLGSSPLTRGKQPMVIPSVLWRGLIPAHAGKTTFRCDSTGIAWAHPRSRGENSIDQLAGKTNDGSSPLTRGKLGTIRPQHSRRRLIPAHAGKTKQRRRTRRWMRAHPRSRGENDAAEHELRAAQGSSPLTRGKRDAFAPGVGDPGLIPAHAGKTTAGQCRRGRQRAHPRSRGENVLTRARPGGHHGSSPLTRGKPSGGR